MADIPRQVAALVIQQEPADSADARYCLDAYCAELAERFEEGFDPGNGNALSVAEMTPPEGWLLLARLDGAPVGCGALKRLDQVTAEVKRVWTAPEARGLRIAAAMMDALEALAAGNGFTTVRLDTNKALVEAQNMYRRRGYRSIERYNSNPYAHQWFEKDLRAASG